ncbi:hypothetical protein OG264_19190 [Streptomyces xanthophaeus]|uniref:hypothetical protein n=1 Tax=Streptomyces xanthophaeus TaxID=67385 RepID=UPI00386361D2|nr:hypothetical protein OG264_19190 [Streptomyces xanthophaeus]WST61582.1 hypothetical protein OG605_19245 [Streptomyces xanthophaeus]
MSGEFDQEWGRERADASARQTATRLNGVDGAPSGPLAPGGPGGPGGFASTPAEKTAAANTIQNELESSTQKAADHADEPTGAAGKGFDGWDTAVGLKKVADTWDKQVAVLMGRLAADKNQLRGASNYIAQNDIGLGDQFRASTSKLTGLSRGE